MEFSINRLTTNRLYTTGILSINGRELCDTVEYTKKMLPAHRKFLLKFVVDSSSHQQQLARTLTVFNPNRRNHPLCILTAGISWKQAKEKSEGRSKADIYLGQMLIPGVLFKNADIAERIQERIKKCAARGEEMTFMIHENRCLKIGPLCHWK